MKKVRTKKYGVIHQIAHCSVCSWVDEGMDTARQEGRKHTYKTGHNVVIESGNHYEYYLVKD